MGEDQQNQSFVEFLEFAEAVSELSCEGQAVRRSAEMWQILGHVQGGKG